ncbi:MAG: DUF1080 domain-containing protein [Candidatus Brocadiia bacterium]
MKWPTMALCVAGLAAAASAAEEGFTPDPEKGWVQLFNGKDLSGWKFRGENKTWEAQDGVLANQRKRDGKKLRGVNIYTEQKFKDFKLHIEFKVPKGGNSGVYLRGRKEIQVHDSYGAKKPGSGHCGGIYSKKAPDVNASKPAGEWQTFDVTIVGETITVVHNGKTIHDGVEIQGHTGGSMGGEPGTPGPLMLQGDHSTVWYRNIWLKPLDEEGEK